MKTFHALIAVVLAITAFLPSAGAKDQEQFRSHHVPDLVFESARLGPINQAEIGPGINGSQYVGVRFEVQENTKITGVGGRVGVIPPLFAGSFRATIVRLPDASAFPRGNPFALDEVVASVLCTPDRELSRDYIFPLKVKLPPGYYALVFGGGQTNAFIPEDNEPLLSDTSFMVWSVSGWTVGGGLEPLRFTLYGTVK